MNVLLIGGGGREHALAWKLAQSPKLTRLLSVPGNPGTARYGQNAPFLLTDVDALIDLAQREAIDLVVVGPDNPLADGIVDRFVAAGIAAFGPTAAAAQIESSKSFAKQIMAECGVPTAESYSFDDPAAAQAFVQQSGRAWVVKADGLALGKGVVVAESLDATLSAIDALSAVSAGKRLLLEERLSGPEVSVIALCDGKTLAPFAPARDHKRLLDRDEGPNTGGMGVFAPVGDLDEAGLAGIVRECMQPVVERLAARGTPFVGTLYAGMMLTASGPKVLEFNARFGDPEAQVILPLMEGDLLEALLACTQGRLSPEMVRRKPGAAVCVVLAAAGYPNRPRRGDPIRGVEALDDPNILVFHAGTSMEPTGLTTAGGRVLGVTGLGANLRQARQRAYEGARRITFAGRQFRQDIAASEGAQ